MSIVIGVRQTQEQTGDSDSFRAETPLVFECVSRQATDILAAWIFSSREFSFEALLVG
jgi:hypothetical protein